MGLVWNWIDYHRASRVFYYIRYSISIDCAANQHIANPGRNVDRSPNY